ncbi:phytanoyl-CoA dioxygenase, peroxisomal isoform b [Hyaloraphidium curvatum]|nr:phytanoyl-CoA dioxygenase, peroxisomal isoform b [Hyaloraphidium curvatum]
MTEIASAFCGYGLKTIDMMVINKPPDAGVTGRHPLHQDLIYFPVFGPTIGVWTAINPATRENGCLSFIPGTHKLGLLRHDVPPWEDKNAGFHGVVGISPENLPLVYAELQPGDTVFFHPFMIHGSGKNRTQKFRKSLTGHYMSTDSTWVQDISNTSMEWPIVDFVNMRHKIGNDPHQANLIMREMWQTVGVYAKGQKREGDQYV